MTVGLHAVGRGRVTAQDTVAIFGCGGVGLGAVAASGFRGAKTIAVDLDDAKLALALRAGATHAINTSKEPLHERLLELTGGRGPDVIIEAIGLPQTFRSAVDEVAFTGRVVYIGYAKEPVAYETKWFVQKEIDILGSRNALPEDFREVIRMLEEHRFPVDEAVSAIVPLEAGAGDDQGLERSSKRVFQDHGAPGLIESGLCSPKRLDGFQDGAKFVLDRSDPLIQATKPR